VFNVVEFTETVDLQLDRSRGVFWRT